MKNEVMVFIPACMCSWTLDPDDSSPVEPVTMVSSVLANGVGKVTITSVAVRIAAVPGCSVLGFPNSIITVVCTAQSLQPSKELILSLLRFISYACGFQHQLSDAAPPVV
jgi:hypothetical protein